MKVCKKCQENKLESDFHKDRKHRDGLSPHCKVCRQSESRAHYQKNKDAYKARSKKASKKERERKRTLLDSIRLKYGCAFCVERELCTLEFHHYHEKTTSVPQASYLASTANLEKEINKCVVVCGNCHRKVHAGLLTVQPEMVCNEVLPRRKRIYPITDSSVIGKNLRSRIGRPKKEERENL